MSKADISSLEVSGQEIARRIELRREIRAAGLSGMQFLDERAESPDAEAAPGALL